MRKTLHPLPAILAALVFSAAILAAPPAPTNLHRVPDSATPNTVTSRSEGTRWVPKTFMVCDLCPDQKQDTEPWRCCNQAEIEIGLRADGTVVWRRKEETKK